MGFHSSIVVLFVCRLIDSAHTFVISGHLLHVIADFNAVHHVVAGLFLLHVLLATVGISLRQGGQPLGLALFQLHVESLSLSDLLLQLLDLVVLHLELTLLIGGLLPLSLALNLVGRLNELDVLFEVVLVLLKVVDLLQKFNIVLHEALVVLVVGVVTLLDRQLQVSNTLLLILSHLGELLRGVGLILALSLDLLRHVHLVQSDNRLLKLLVVSDVVEGVVHLVFELAGFFDLTAEHGLQSTVLSDKTLHAHLKIFDNQAQVHEHPIEVKSLLLHLIGLLLQLINSVATGSNVPLQLLDLVVKNKFELLQLLSLLLQIVDSLLLVPDGGFSFGQLQGLRSNVGL